MISVTIDEKSVSIKFRDLHLSAVHLSVTHLFIYVDLPRYDSLEITRHRLV
jgi:hypothetical protein